MAYDHRSLQALEALVNEFNDTGSNARKREIEGILCEFKKQPDAWKQALYYLTQSQNYFFSMICLLTLENVINKQWSSLPVESRSEICSSLYGTLIESHKTLQIGVKNKIIKLIVDIARFAWPHLYPDFLTNVLSLSQNSETSVLCLIFIKTISEELINSREELPYERKAELNKLFLQNIGCIVEVLNGFLDALVEKNRNVGTATPPPSPTQGSHSPSPARTLCGSDLQSTLHSNSIMHSVLNRRTEGFGNVPVPTLDNECRAVASLSLECIAHLFSWVPLHLVISPHLLENIFIFASMGAESVPESQQNGQDHRISGPPLGVLAMGVINEILSKNYIPSNLEEFLVLTFRNTSQLLHKLTTEEHLLSADNTMYREKFSDFLRLFVSLHLKRFENSPQFPVLGFLELLYRYTFLQRQTKCYVDCLNIWDIFMDHLLAQTSTNQPEMKYKEALLHLARSIITRTQFRHNQDICMQMSHVIDIHSSGIEDDDEVYGSNVIAELEETSEFQSFVTQNVETLAKVADLFPEDILAIVFEPFTTTCKEFLELQDTIMVGLNFKPFSENDIANLHCLLRDTATLLQAVGRFSPFFLGKNLVSRSSWALQVIERLIDMVNFTVKFKLYEQKSSSTLIYQDFVEIHAQILSTMKAWTYWLSQLYGQQFVEVSPGGSLVHHFQQTCHTIHKQMLHAAVEAITCGAPLFVRYSGAQLFSSLSVLVKSPVPLEMKEVHNLYNNVFILVPDDKIRKTVSRSLVNILLLPWPSFIANHRMDIRKHHLATFIHSFTKEFLCIESSKLAGNSVEMNNNSNTVINTLIFVRSQIDELNGTDKQSRETYYQCIQPVIEQSLKLFPVYATMLEPCEAILSLVTVAMDVLMHQMGATYVLDIIQRLLNDVYANDIISKALKIKEPVSLHILEKFLAVLEIVSREPGASFKKALPNTISLCMDMVYPLVESDDEIMVPLFRLLFTLIDHNWKYFFRGNVQNSLGRNDVDFCQNADRFIQIIRSFGKTFMGDSITLFKQNLQALEELNKRYKLYHRDIVKSNVLGELITVLIQVLLNRSLDSLQDEIFVAIYHMASVDFEGFFSAFLPHFLENFDGIHLEQKKYLTSNFTYATDLPTFTQNMARFTNDIRFHRICSAHTLMKGG